MRELKVEDALLYLDQVKCEFGDQPHIYNEFLDIMKTFKTQQIDTPGVIRRVSNLFRGNRRLVLGFNTFLPEGYKIELPEGDGPAVAVYRAPGSSHGIVLGPGEDIPSGNWMQQQPPAQPGQPPGPPPPGRPGMPTGPPRPPHQMGMHPQQGGPPPPRPPPPQPHVGAGPGLKGPPMSQHGVDPSTMPKGGPINMKVSSRPMPPDRDVSGDGAMKGPPTSDRMGWAPQQQPPQHPSTQQPAGLTIAQPPMNGGLTGGMRGPAGGSQGYSDTMAARGNPQQQPPPSQQAQPPPPPPSSSPGGAPGQQPPAAKAGGAAAGNEGQGVVEFDHAINYVTTIKKRFANEPYTYKKFLEILHTYQKEQRGIKEVLEEVSTLFADHPDLLKEFTYFLPDAVQAQAKAQLDQVAKEAEARKRTKAKQAIMNQAQGMQRQTHTGGRAAPTPSSRPSPDFDRASGAISVPFGAAQGRTPDHENNIIRSAHFGVVSFAPVRPPKRNELTPAQAAAKYGRPKTIPELPLAPNTAESTFFQKAKDHLNRKELAADRAPGSKRHTPYTEFLKCLHLYGAGILRKDELLLLLKGLFTQGHAPKSGMNASGGNANPSIAQTAAELLREFEELLIGRGPYAHQEVVFKDKSKYGGLSVRDFDFTGCEAPTPSYRSYPLDFPLSLFMTHPGQMENDERILNSKLVCVGASDRRSDRSLRSPEEYDAVRIRQNVYEEEMFRVEDERFEVDLAIERNSQAMKQIEPFAEEVQNLREQEEKDGQPIGRLQYQLNRYAMDTIHLNAIGRLYGDKGDEVVQHLLQNPLIVLPIVYHRLKQKDLEWRQVKQELSERWNAAYEANYEGSRDVTCVFYRQAFEKRFTKSQLLDDCKRAKTFCLHPAKLHHDPAYDAFIPTYSLSCSDPVSLLFQPHAIVKCNVSASHKEAFQLVSFRLKNSGLSASDRERIGRIWAEFMVPWFNYPSYWVVDEVRESFGGTLSPSVVKYALGQRVATQFGVGVIQACLINESGAASYRVKLPFGIAHLSPSAILFAIPSKDLPYVRRDGKMVRDSGLVENGGGGNSTHNKLDEKYEMLFGTESIYLFLRLYLLLCSLLDNIRNHCETFGCSGDPSKDYCRLVSRPTEDDSSETPRLDYASLLTSLRKVLSNDLSAKDFETFGRMISREKVYLISTLPQLIDRCGQALLATAQEDCLLHLYDYCQYRQVDPVAVRTHCFSMSPQAVYRIQYDTSSGHMYWNHLPRSMELVTVPTLLSDMTTNSSHHHHLEASITNSSTAMSPNKVSPLDEGGSEADPIDEYESNDNDDNNGGGDVVDPRPTKRTKVQ